MGVWSHTSSGIFNADSFILKYETPGWLGSQFDRVFMDLLMLGGVAVMLVWLIFDYTIISFFNFLR